MRLSESGVNVNLHELFDCSTSGVLTWKARPRSHFSSDKGMKIFNTAHSGRVAGGMSVDGYAVVGISMLGTAQLVKLHNIVWEMLVGPIGDGMFIDHKDADRRNNDIGNLRECSRAENNRNQKKRSDNTSGYKGVSWHKAAGKWAAHIHKNGKKIHLGLFDNPESAYARYCEAAAEMHGEFARLA